MHLPRLPRALWVLLLVLPLVGFGSQEPNFCPDTDALTIGCMQDGQRRYAPLDAMKIGYVDGKEVARLSYAAMAAPDYEDVPGNNYLTIVKSAGSYEVITDQLANYERVDDGAFGPTFFLFADVEGLEQKQENPPSDLRVFLVLSGVLLAGMGAAAGAAWLIMGSRRSS